MQTRNVCSVAERSARGLACRWEGRTIGQGMTVIGVSGLAHASSCRFGKAWRQRLWIGGD